MVLPVAAGAGVAPGRPAVRRGVLQGVDAALGCQAGSRVLLPLLLQLGAGPVQRRGEGRRPPVVPVAVRVGEGLGGGRRGRGRDRVPVERRPAAGL